MNDGGHNGTDYFGIKVRVDAANFTNIIIAGFENDKIWSEKSKVFIKNKVKVASRLGGVQ